jgi:tetratricopeptide (TPR) repeat protein
MKPIFPVTGIALFSLTSVAIAQLDTEVSSPEDPQAAGAQAEEPQQEPVVPDEDPAIKGLTKDEREDLRRLLDDASRFIGGIRLQEGLAKLLEAEQIAPELFQIHNLRGAAYTKMRDYKTAEEQFKKAISLRPGVFHPQFNLAEIEFVTKNYSKSEASFQKLIEDFPGMDLGTRRLLEFKLIVCRLKQDDPTGAKAMLDTFTYLDDTPIYHLGHAAVAYANDDIEDAESWISSANKIYSASQVEVFRDSLIEAGWIETL